MNPNLLEHVFIGNHDCGRIMKLRFDESDPEISIHPERLRTIIRGALKDTINCHGPVNKGLIGSVLKRIIKQIEIDAKTSKD